MRSFLVTNYLTMPAQIIALLVAFSHLGIAEAQQTGGVFGPNITPDSQAVEFRVAFAPSDDGQPDAIASRFHYQATATDTLRFRAVVQGRGAPADQFDFDFVQFEAQWQFRNAEEHGWTSALRLDLQLADERRDLLGLNWTSDFKLSEKLTFRQVLLTAVQLGDQAQDGLFLQTRSALLYKISQNYSLQLQSFNLYGSTENIPEFDRQNHGVGPALSGKIGNGWAFEASALFGVSDAASDVDLRLFLVRNF